VGKRGGRDRQGLESHEFRHRSAALVSCWSRDCNVMMMVARLSSFSITCWT